MATVNGLQPMDAYFWMYWRKEVSTISMYYYGLDEVFLDFSFGSKKETWEKKIAGPFLKGTAGRKTGAGKPRTLA